MQFKLFPNPSNGLCTPFLFDSELNGYFRLIYNKSGFIKTSVKVIDNTAMLFDYNDKKNNILYSYSLPNREKIIDFLEKQKEVNLLKYIKENFVVPTFPLSKLESFIKTTIRQIVTAGQAKKQFSKFVFSFGEKKDGLYCFPTIEFLKRKTIDEYKSIGLGLKAKRIWNGVNEIAKNDNITLLDLPGIGPWSKRILEVDAKMDYSLYPFDDKSGDKIKETIGIDLFRISKTNSRFSGDLYIYAASYLEANR
ncbi:MAG: hypothetical protein GY795_02390 [Desulfobacterales bacterium]|nr:hypothetical protein [Desulfobacterales bacterium]